MLDFLIFAITILVFLVVGVIYLYPCSKRPTSIPGPEPVDILEGNNPDITSCGGLHPFLEKVHQDYGPIVSFWMGPQMMVSIAKASLFEEQAAIFDRAGDLFCSYLPLIGEDSIQVTNGAEARRRHAAYSKCLMLSAIKSFFPVYNELSKQTVENWRTWTAEEYIPVREQMLDYAIKAVLRSAFNVELDDQLITRVRASYDVCMNECNQQSCGDYPEAGGARIKRFEQCKKVLYDVLREAVRCQKKSNSSEKDCNLVAAALSLDLPESTVLSDLVTFFIGGFQTSASLMVWAIYYLALYPDIQERVRKEVVEVLGSVTELNEGLVDELEYLQQVVNETLRIMAGGPFAGRQQEFDTVLGGHQIPAGTPVIHALHVALHDPDVFPEPDKFDPERFSKENILKLPHLAFEPFGFAGTRKCPGYRFGMYEAMTFLAVLLRANLRLVLAPDQVVIPKTSIVTFPVEELWLTVEEIKG